MKQHKLDTINQIVDVVNKKNLNIFMNDFKLFLEMRIGVKKLDGVEMGKTFLWTDDGVIGLKKLTIKVE